MACTPTGKEVGGGMDTCGPRVSRLSGACNMRQILYPSSTADVNNFSAMNEDRFILFFFSILERKKFEIE